MCIYTLTPFLCACTYASFGNCPAHKGRLPDRCPDPQTKINKLNPIITPMNERCVKHGGAVLLEWPFEIEGEGRGGCEGEEGKKEGKGGKKGEGKVEGEKEVGKREEKMGKECEGRRREDVGVEVEEGSEEGEIVEKKSWKKSKEERQKEKKAGRSGGGVKKRVSKSLKEGILKREQDERRERFEDFLRSVG